MDKHELAFALRGYTGSEQWYRWSVLFRKCLLTDGTKFLAESAGCYWLMDAVASHIAQHSDPFVVAELKRVEGNAFVLTLDDGNGRIWATQDIEFSDFPLDSIKLYAVWDTLNWTIMLPTEY